MRCLSRSGRSALGTKRETLAAYLLIAILTIFFHALVVLPILWPQGFLVKYEWAAGRLLAGGLREGRLYDFSPFYLALHAAVMALGLDVHVGVEVLQIIACALSGLLLYHLLRRFVGRVLAAAGFLAFLFNRSVILYTHTLEPEIWLALFLLGFAACVLGTRRRPLVAGILLALAMVCRSNLALLTPLVAGWLWLIQGRSRSGLADALRFSSPLVAMVLFLGVAGPAITGSSYPFFMNPGTVFYEGNGPFSTGSAVVYPPVVAHLGWQHTEETDYQHVAYRRVAAADNGNPASVRGANAFWSARARRFIASHPRRAVNLFLRKVWLFFHEVRLHDINPTLLGDVALSESRIPSLPLALISSLALVGMVGFWRRGRGAWIVPAVVGIQVLSLGLMYVTDRQRVSVIPFLVVLACAGAERLFRSRLKLVTGLVVVGLYILFTWQPASLTDLVRYWRDFYRSAALRDASAGAWASGGLPEAVTLAARAYRISPWLREWTRIPELPTRQIGMASEALRVEDPSRREDETDALNRARMLLDDGRAPEARRVLEELVRNGVEIPSCGYRAGVLVTAGRSALMEGDIPGAVGYLERALVQSPSDPYALSLRAVLPGGEAQLEGLRAGLDALDTDYLLGLAWLDASRPDMATEYFGRVVGRLPDYRIAKIYLAVAMGRAGRDEDAAAIYHKAMELGPSPLYMERDILGIFKRLAAARSDGGIRLRRYAIVLSSFGRFEESLSILEELMARQPSRPTSDLRDHVKILYEAMRSANSAHEVMR